MTTATPIPLRHVVLAMAGQDGHALFSASKSYEFVSLILELDAAWRAFCALSLYEKLLLHGGPSSDSDGEDDRGYFLRNGALRGDGSGIRQDLDKEVFHYRPSLPRELCSSRQFDRYQAVMHRDRELLRLCSEVYNIALGYYRQMCSAADVYFDTGLSRKFDSRYDGHTLRLLRYFGNRVPGSVLAKGHADRNTFTIHLFQSGPGLERFDGSGWVPVELTPGQILAFPGRKAISDGVFPSLTHRVVVRGPEVGARTSIVFFGHHYR